MKKLSTPSLLLYLAMALGLTGWQAWQWGWGTWTESWPTVEGSISSSRVSSYRMRNSQNYVPAIEYRYKVGDRSFIGDDVTVGGDEMSEAECEAVVERYPARAKVPVYHHPYQHQRALLIPGVPPTAGFLALLGLGASGVLIGLLVWRSRQPLGLDAD